MYANPSSATTMELFAALGIHNSSLHSTISRKAQSILLVSQMYLKFYKCCRILKFQPSRRLLYFWFCVLHSQSVVPTKSILFSNSYLCLWAFIHKLTACTSSYGIFNMLSFRNLKLSSEK